MGHALSAAAFASVLCFAVSTLCATVLEALPAIGKALRLTNRPSMGQEHRRAKK